MTLNATVFLIAFFSIFDTYFHYHMHVRIDLVDQKKISTNQFSGQVIKTSSFPDETFFWILNHSVKALLHSKFLTQVENKNPFSSFSFSWRNLCFSLRSTDDSLWGFFLVFLAGCLYFCSCSYWNLRKGACRLGIVVAITSKATFLFLTDRAVQEARRIKEGTKGSFSTGNTKQAEMDVAYCHSGCRDKNLRLGFT